MDSLSFALSEDVLSVKWLEEGDEVVINCALDGKPRISECSIKGYPYRLWAYAYEENGRVNAVVKPLNTLSTQYITFDFSKKNTVGVQMKSTPGFTEFIVKNASHSSFIDNHPKLRPVTVGVLKAVLSTTERPMIFKAKK